MRRIGWIGRLLAAALLLASAGAPAQIVTTLAGSGAQGSADGPASQATFLLPRAVATDNAGNVYVADFRSVRRVTADGLVTTLPVPVSGPVGVAADGSGNVYVLDGANGTGPVNVLHISPSGQVKTLATFYSIEGFTGISLDRFGNLIVTNPGDYFEGAGGGEIYNVTAAVAAVSLTGPGTQFPFEDPWNAVADPAGNLYVTRWGGSVAKLAPSGTSTTLASGFSGTGIAVDRLGGVYVAAGNQILRIAPDGTRSVVAGSGAAGSDDGPGSSATFNAPQGIALDDAGNLYVADRENHKIRRVVVGTGSACLGDCSAWTVPSAARAAGPNGSFWTSSLTVHNGGSTAETLTLKFLGHDADGSAGPQATVTLGARQTVTYADVLASAFGIAEGYGALQVRTASSRIVVRSRTSTIDSGGTVGDGIPGVRFDRFITDQTQPSPVLTGLREDEAFRTNLILVNGSATPVDVLVTAFDSSGAALGSKTVTLPPLGMTQIGHVLSGPEFGAGMKADVTISLSTATPGGAFTACALVIDNGSNAPTAVMPQ